MRDVDRFSLPPEWADHEATWLAWPRDPRTWIAGIDPVEDAYVGMVQALAPGERVELIHPPGDAKRIRKRLDEEGVDVHTPGSAPDPPPRVGVRLHEVTYVDSWIRDTGPLVLTRGKTEDRLALDWRFNAWGGKYEALEQDDALGRHIANEASIPSLRVETVLEGGAIDVDGQGRMLTTEACLLNDNRGDRSRGFLEDVFALLLGVEDVLWLGGGLAGDDTDGHVDTLARFTRPGHVVTCRPPPKGEVNHGALRETLERLERFVEEGLIEDVTLLPLPDPVTFEGERFPASYANFYIGNEAVLVPAFDDANDEEACAILDGIFPHRRIVPIPARALAVGYGACHCVTMQIPSPGTASPT